MRPRLRSPPTTPRKEHDATYPRTHQALEVASGARKVTTSGRTRLVAGRVHRGAPCSCRDRGGRPRPGNRHWRRRESRWLRKLVEANIFESEHAWRAVEGEHPSSRCRTPGEDLHPVDQAAAFKALRETGATDADLCGALRRVRIRTVQRRLRMAARGQRGLVDARRRTVPDPEAVCVELTRRRSRPWRCAAAEPRDRYLLARSWPSQLAEFVSTHTMLPCTGTTSRGPVREGWRGRGSSWTTRAAGAVDGSRLDDAGARAERGDRDADIGRPDRWWEKYDQMRAERPETAKRFGGYRDSQWPPRSARRLAGTVGPPGRRQNGAGPSRRDPAKMIEFRARELPAAPRRPSLRAEAVGGPAPI